MRTIQQQLIEKGLSESKKTEPKKPRHIKEVLSKKDLEELMGVLYADI